MQRSARKNRSSRLIALFLSLIFIAAFLTPVSATPTDPNLIWEIQNKQLSSPVVGVYYVPFGGEFTILYEQNALANFSPASLTKLMTLFTAKRIIDDKMLPLDTVYTVREEDYAGLAEAGIAVMGLTEGDEVTLEDLLYGTLLASGADAVNALISALGTDRAQFVYFMNEIAKNSGWQMSFKDPVGLYDHKQIVTARDTAKLLFACLVDPLLNQLLHQKYYVTGPTQLYPDGIAMQHSMIGYGAALNIDTTLIQGGKTGWLPESGYNLASFQDLDSGTLLIVTMGAANAGENVLDHLDLLLSVNRYVQLPLAADADIPELEEKIGLLREGVIPTETEATTTEQPTEAPTETVAIAEDEEEETTTEATSAADRIITTETLATTTTAAATTEATTTVKELKTMEQSDADRTITWIFYLTLAFLSLVLIIVLAELARLRRKKK